MGGGVSKPKPSPWISVTLPPKERSEGKVLATPPDVQSSEVRLRINELLSQPSNQICSDCDAHHPEWLSLNLKVWICLECSGAHRSLGTSVSQVRSVMLDKLTLNQLQTFTNNLEMNQYYEYHGYISCQNQIFKPHANSNRLIRAKFITAKYQDLMFIPQSPQPQPQKQPVKPNNPPKKSPKNESENPKDTLQQPYNLSEVEMKSSLSSDSIDNSDDSSVVVATKPLSLPRSDMCWDDSSHVTEQSHSESQLKKQDEQQKCDPSSSNTDNSIISSSSLTSTNNPSNPNNPVQSETKSQGVLMVTPREIEEIVFNDTNKKKSNKSNVKYFLEVSCNKCTSHTRDFTLSNPNNHANPSDVNANGKEREIKSNGLESENTPSLKLSFAPLPFNLSFTAQDQFPSTPDVSGGRFVHLVLKQRVKFRAPITIASAFVGLPPQFLAAGAGSENEVLLIWIAWNTQGRILVELQYTHLLGPLS